MNRHIVWQGESVPGKEILSLQAHPHRIIVLSHVSGGDADAKTKWNAEYTVILDDRWRVREVKITETITGTHLSIQSDGHGHWHNADGKVIDTIADCVDIDFRATPFSNTLPIKRLGLKVGESAAIEVAYIDAPSLHISRESQIYTRVSETTWKFEQPAAKFTAAITVDEDGFVVEYPGLFHRV